MTVEDDAKKLAAKVRADAEQAEAKVLQDVDNLEERLRKDPRLVQEWLKQNSLIYGGLIGIGVIIIQPFLTAPSLDLAATICVVAFSIAIPILGSLVMLNEQELSRRKPTDSRFVDLARAVAQFAAVVGVVAAFWHIAWQAGVGVIVAGIVAVAVQSAGYTLRDLEEAVAPAPK